MEFLSRSHSTRCAEYSRELKKEKQLIFQEGNWIQCYAILQQYQEQDNKKKK